VEDSRGSAAEIACGDGNYESRGFLSAYRRCFFSMAGRRFLTGDHPSAGPGALLLRDIGQVALVTMSREIPSAARVQI